MMARSIGARRPRPTPRRILLLAMLPIGDTLFIMPTVRALRQRYPTAHIAALTYANNAPILRYAPEVDQIIMLPPIERLAGLVALIPMIAHLHAWRFDVAVDFTSPAFKWISLLAGIPLRTYMKFDPLWWLVPQPHTRWRAMHATRIYYECARELDLPPWDAIDQRPFVALPADAQVAGNGFLERHGIAGGERPLVAMHPGGAGLGGHKRWPARHFAEVADHLCERWNAQIVLLGGDEERTLAEEVAALMRHDAVVAAGALSLLEAFALINRCDLFVGNDSSLLHAAAAQGVPYVGIFGPTSLANFQPIAAQRRQGRIAAPSPPARHLSYFIGGRPIWQQAGHDTADDSLASIPPALVMSYADELLAARLTRENERDLAYMKDR